MEDQIKTAQEVVSTVLTGLSEPSTLRRSPYILPKSLPEQWADQCRQYLKFQTLSDPVLEKMQAEAVRFLVSMRERREKPYWLVLCGKSGTGKTHLAKKVFSCFNKFIGPINQLLIDGRVVGNTSRFVDWREFSNDHKAGRFWDTDWLSSDETWLVVLDDVGAEYDPSGFILSKLDLILNGRLGLYTLITTNMPFKDIAEKLDPRIASRMLRGNSVIVECDTEDYCVRDK